MKEQQSTTLKITPPTAGREPQTIAFQPVRMLEVELGRPLPVISACDSRTGLRYRRAQILVRLHTLPLGILDLDLPESDLGAEAYANQIWSSLHQAINAHLRQDNLPEVNELTAAGLTSLNEPRCIQEQHQFLDQAPFFSVVVCTRDRTELLAECLQSLLGLEYPRFEIIIVDNAPRTPATADLIKGHFQHVPHIRYVREDRPGLSWARNLGLRCAQGELIAYTDDDALVDPNWLTALAQSFQVAENVACVTGLTLSAEIETQAQDWFEQFGGHSKGRGFNPGLFNTTTHAAQSPFLPVPAFGAGVNMAFKTSLLQQLGGFDPGLGVGTCTLGSEDTVAFCQVLVKGYTLVYTPAAIVRHFHRRDYAGLRRQLYGYGVGTSAFYTWCLQDLKNIWPLIQIIPPVLRYFFSPRSNRVSKMKSDYPRELTWVELRGLLYGPVAFLRSRWNLRRIVKQFGPPEAGWVHLTSDERQVR